MDYWSICTAVYFLCTICFYHYGFVSFWAFNWSKVLHISVIYICMQGNSSTLNLFPWPFLLPSDVTSYFMLTALIFFVGFFWTFTSHFIFAPSSGDLNTSSGIQDMWLYPSKTKSYILHKETWLSLWSCTCVICVLL